MLGFDEGWKSGFVRSLIRHALFILLPVAVYFYIVACFPQWPVWFSTAVLGLAGISAFGSTIGAIGAVPALVRFCTPDLRWQAFAYGLCEALLPTLLLSVSIVVGLVVLEGEIGRLGHSVLRIGLICLGLEAAILAAMTLFGLRRSG